MTVLRATAAAPRRGDLGPRPWMVSLGFAVCAGSILIGFSRDPVRVWSNLLIDGFLLVALALGALTVVAIHHLSAAEWSAGVRRAADALIAVLPYGCLALLIVCLGSSRL